MCILGHLIDKHLVFMKLAETLTERILIEGFQRLSLFLLSDLKTLFEKYFHTLLGIVQEALIPLLWKQCFW